MPHPTHTHPLPLDDQVSVYAPRLQHMRSGMAAAQYHGIINKHQRAGMAAL